MFSHKLGHQAAEYGSFKIQLEWAVQLMTIKADYEFYTQLAICLGLMFKSSFRNLSCESVCCRTLVDKPILLNLP